VSILQLRTNQERKEIWQLRAHANVRANLCTAVDGDVSGSIDFDREMNEGSTGGPALNAPIAIELAAVAWANKNRGGAATLDRDIASLVGARRCQCVDPALVASDEDRFGAHGANVTFGEVFDIATAYVTELRGASRLRRASEAERTPSRARSPDLKKPSS
jgi:hypothetical protein